MGKATYKGLVPPDDPMFSNGPEIFSCPESNESSTTPQNATTGATQDQSSSATAPADLQNLPEDPAIRPMLLINEIPHHLWPEGVISNQQASDLIKEYGRQQRFEK